MTRTFMNYQQLKAAITELVRRKDAAKIDSPEHVFALRMLNSLRYTYEDAEEIWEGMDAFWDATPLSETPAPEGQLLPLRRTAVSDQE